MADRHDLNITISKNGEVQIEVQGISGPKCLKTTEVIENELGDVISREKTSEYYKKEIMTKIDVKK